MHLRIQQFVREYLIDLNASAAARRCGYPAHTAKTRGNKLMARKDVQEAVKQAMAERAARTGITADRVVLEFARIAFADARKFADWGPWGMRLLPAASLGDDAAAAVAALRVGGARAGRPTHLRLHDKLRALDMLGRHLGLWTERRRTYRLNPNDSLADRAAAARIAREARAIVRGQIADEDAELAQLAQEVEQAWRDVFGGEATAATATLLPRAGDDPIPVSSNGADRTP